MNSLQLELTQLIGKKEDASVDAMPATLSDFHMWACKEYSQFEQLKQAITLIIFSEGYVSERIIIPYDSSKDLLKQSDDTLKQIIELIKSNL